MGCRVGASLEVARTVQRFFNTTIAWSQVLWLIIRHYLLDRDKVLVLEGDEVVVIKAGKSP